MNNKIHFIINPIAGQPYPILNTITHVCAKHDVEWTHAVTSKDNIDQLAQDALRCDADIVAVYGGDGTISAVANALIHSDKTLGILPGGTANVLSIELGIPQDIRRACALLCRERPNILQMDVGKVNNHHFMLRVAFGFEAEAVKAADRQFKNKLGVLAYALSSLKALWKTKVTTYELTIDGKSYEREGVSLVVANSGNLGLSGISLLPKISVLDGYLDVILIRTADLQALFDSEGDGPISDKIALFEHWQAKKVSVITRPAQSVHYDGEVLESEELTTEIISGALKIVVR